MKNLQKFLKRHNAFNAIFQGGKIRMPRNLSECDNIRDIVENELSPENLACDGEASMQHVREEGRFLKLVLKDLDMKVLQIASKRARTRQKKFIAKVNKAREIVVETDDGTDYFEKVINFSK